MTKNVADVSCWVNHKEYFFVLLGERDGDASGLGLHVVPFDTEIYSRGHTCKPQVRLPGSYEICWWQYGLCLFRKGDIMEVVKTTRRIKDRANVVSILFVFQSCPAT